MTKIERITVSMGGRRVGHAAQTVDGRCTFADSIEPRDADVLTVAERGGLDRRRARQVLEKMRAEVAAGL